MVAVTSADEGKSSSPWSRSSIQCHGDDHHCSCLLTAPPRPARRVRTRLPRHQGETAALHAPSGCRRYRRRRRRIGIAHQDAARGASADDFPLIGGRRSRARSNCRGADVGADGSLAEGGQTSCRRPGSGGFLIEAEHNRRQMRCLDRGRSGAPVSSWFPIDCHAVERAGYDGHAWLFSKRCRRRSLGAVGAQAPEAWRNGARPAHRSSRAMTPARPTPPDRAGGEQFTCLEHRRRCSRHKHAGRRQAPGAGSRRAAGGFSRSGRYLTATSGASQSDREAMRPRLPSPRTPGRTRFSGDGSRVTGSGARCPAALPRRWVA